ncbi:hypothetical protein [Bradyrhizobium sp. Leo170]|uniref:hypothetical protein n=1 Tax=Bradyrhizobium sp. Leo170 TaxID=1571199 RepID=UPI00102E8998|nr:hypothetical protein [Bradyrhizobium sp. Leo170]TAI67630.1 hypothetical protein CWO89_02095 [Bradyrhizobium sp. Leo170]
MARKGAINVLLDGRGGVTLRESDYITTGGEGSIYKTGQTVVKLYTDPNKMARDGMPEKVKMLARLQHPGIVAPHGLVLDDSRKPIGFYMPFVVGEPMSRVFVSDYRSRTGFGEWDAVAVTQCMFDIVAYAHTQQVLLVDANELNWLVHFTKGNAASASVIDVDSWAIGRWPATVIMPSIRDWSAKAFSPETDWFAWGIVAFQVFTGIHPFKGRIEGYKPGDLVRRMKDNASVFDQRAKLPLSVRDFSCIPGPLLDWFQATFQLGKRGTPPAPTVMGKPAKAAQVMRAVTTAAGGALVFEKLFARTGDPVTRIWANGAVRLASGELCDLETGMSIAYQMPADAEVIKVPEGWVISLPTSTEIVFAHIPYEVVGGVGGRRLAEQPLLPLRRIFRAGKTLFGVTDRQLIELELNDVGRPRMIMDRRWNMLVGATTWLDDVAVTNALGNAFVVLPHAGGISQIRVAELDGKTVVAGKACGRFAAFTVVDKQGVYGKVELTFDKTFTRYQAWVGPADGPELNMAILPRGVVATITDDFEITIFVPTTGTVNKVRDTGVSTAMKLAAWSERIVYILDGAVWQMRMAP